MDRQACPQVTLKLSLFSDEGCAFAVEPETIVISSGLAAERGAPSTVAPLKLTLPKFVRPRVPRGPWFDDGASVITSADESAA
jgi:hypothetical protein